MNWLRKIALTMLVLGISTAIFLLMVSDKQTKKEVLRPTLEALGTQLFNAVRDDSEKHELEKNYQLFVNRAEAQEIPPEQVEDVAAQILNLSSKDSLISSREALALLTIEAPTVVVKVDSPGQDGYHINIAAPVAEANPIVFKRPPKMGRTYTPEEMAERLRSMQSFQIQMEKLARVSDKKHTIRQKYYFSPTDSGLTVRVDATLRDALGDENSDLARKLKELEKKRWLEWEQKHRELELEHVMSNDSLRRVFDEVAKWSVIAKKFGQAIQDSILQETKRAHEEERLKELQRLHQEPTRPEPPQ